MGLGVSRETLNRDIIIPELNKIRLIATDNTLSQKDRERLIKEIIFDHGEQGHYATNPFFYINLDEMILIHLILKDDSHICYIHRPCKKSYARIIYPGSNSTEGSYLEMNILQDIQEAANNLVEKLKSLENMSLNDAIDLAKKTPDSLKNYVKNDNSINHSLLLNKVNGYLGFGNFLMDMPDIPMNEEVIEAFTKRLLQGLKPY